MDYLTDTHGEYLQKQPNRTVTIHTVTECPLGPDRLNITIYENVPLNEAFHEHFNEFPRGRIVGVFETPYPL